MILSRAQTGATVLDLGCCFGQDLRLLAADGAPTRNMYASDISKELWQLGFKLFRDQEKMNAKFLQANVLDQNSDLEQLNGKTDIIIVRQFLHLFDWGRQIYILKKIVRFSKIGSMIVGYQRGQVHALTVTRPWGQMFLHDLKTFGDMLRQAEVETDTQWDLEIDLVDLREWGMEDEDVQWMPPGAKGLNFVITRQN